MTPEQFAYWMQGFVELGRNSRPSEEQWKSICEHLGTVFKKVTPPVAESSPLDGQTSGIDWGKIQRDMQKQTFPQYPQPYLPNTQPYWLQSGTVVCQSTPNIC